MGPPKDDDGGGAPPPYTSEKQNVSKEEKKTSWLARIGVFLGFLSSTTEPRPEFQSKSESQSQSKSESSTTTIRTTREMVYCKHECEDGHEDGYGHGDIYAHGEVDGDGWIKKRCRRCKQFYWTLLKESDMLELCICGRYHPGKSLFSLLFFSSFFWSVCLSVSGFNLLFTKWAC